jgi:outer membrane protein assembly factor BamE (lipoprotein component of BamABCDE complex)
MTRSMNLGRSDGGLCLCLALVVLLLVAAACAPATRNRGSVLPAEGSFAFEPGVTTREDVLESLGSPSSANLFGGETWYYISSRTETSGALDPEVIDQRVLAVAFDQDGKVKEVTELGLEDREIVELVSRETPTYGKQLGVLQQLVGNIGRFSKGEAARP